MVGANHHLQESPSRLSDKKIQIKWLALPIEEICQNNFRLEASVYGIEGRHARNQLEKSKWPITNLCGANGFATAYHRPRFRRVYVEKSDNPIYQPAQVNELNPKPTAFISHLTITDINALKVQKGQVLLTCSGTVGNCTYVSETLKNRIFSHDLIRIQPKENPGFIYAYLKSEFGRTIINTNNYGAVVSHIEPEHLQRIPIPNPPAILKQEISNLIEESFKLRDESNKLIGDAQNCLAKQLRLPSVGELQKDTDLFDRKTQVVNFSAALGELDGRLDASYHHPIVKVIERHLAAYADEVPILNDKRLIRCVILPGRFKRIYVGEGSGIIFFSGKNILELDPVDKKYLSFAQHEEKIKRELTIKEDMILVTCSGTIGKVALVPKHWDGWAMTHDIIRIVPRDKQVAGYLYTWLSSPYAYELIKRYAYGAVVGHIEKEHILKVPVPLLNDKSQQEKINMMALEVNNMRTKAYELEQKALDILYRQVIYSHS